MRYWSMVLHFYQPPNQEITTTKLILDSCYLPVLRLLNQKPKIGFTLNLSGSLLLQLQQLKATEFFNLIKKLLDYKKIEIINSVIYHPIIPITPIDVTNRQITKNQSILQDIFNLKNIDGFFPPELAVDTDIVNLIKSRYFIIDQTATKKQGPIIKFKDKYLLVNNNSICDLLRSYPQELSIDIVLNLIQKKCNDNDLLVTANDVELFGHHYEERIQVLNDLLDSRDIKFITASEAISQFGSKVSSINNIKSSTWQNCQDFSLWNKNNLQKEYLNLLKKGHNLLLGNLDDQINDCLDRSYSSCHLYWLSNWPWWHPSIVQSGANNLITSIRKSSLSNTQKIEMEIDYHNFLSKIWQYHWSGLVEKKYQKYNQTDDKFLRV